MNDRMRRPLAGGGWDIEHRRTSLCDTMGCVPVPVVDRMPDLSDEVDDEYVNDECPAECSTEHDVPDPYDCDARFTCPDNGQGFYYCSGCGGWQEQSRYGIYPTLIGDDWYCDPYDHGFQCCDGCEEWMSEADHFACTDDGCYCSSECRGEYGYSTGRYGGTATVPVQRCATCSTDNVHYCELSERYVCDHIARELRDRRWPVRLAHPLEAVAA